MILHAGKKISCKFWITGPRARADGDLECGSARTAKFAQPVEGLHSLVHLRCFATCVNEGVVDTQVLCVAVFVGLLKQSLHFGQVCRRQQHHDHLVYIAMLLCCLLENLLRCIHLRASPTGFHCLNPQSTILPTALLKSRKKLNGLFPASLQTELAHLLHLLHLIGLILTSGAAGTKAKLLSVEPLFQAAFDPSCNITSL
mmetsp:Transcript_3067/g.7099  ORF Transcript_3067/g.7099 Transcript_3067/m.7099 type:complete len:200 (-) Transcript_3067:65-664(-)